MSYAEQQRNIAGQILKNNIIEDEIPYITKEEFENYPMSLLFQECFMKMIYCIHTKTILNI